MIDLIIPEPLRENSDFVKGFVTGSVVSELLKFYEIELTKEVIKVFEPGYPSLKVELNFGASLSGIIWFYANVYHTMKDNIRVYNNSTFLQDLLSAINRNLKVQPVEYSGFLISDVVMINPEGYMGEIQGFNYDKAIVKNVTDDTLHLVYIGNLKKF